jgi:hypothetical protein
MHDNYQPVGAVLSDHIAPLEINALYVKQHSHPYN